MGYTDFNREKIEETLGNDYHVIFINYEKKNGIEVAHTFGCLSNSIEDFYKMYVFSKEAMYTCVNFGDEKKMTLVRKEELKNVVEKIVYLNEEEITKVIGGNYNKIIVNTGFIGNKQVYQYAGLE
jgi:hypothetical protein